MSFGFCSSSVALAPVSPKGSCEARRRSFGQNLAQLEIPACVRYTSQNLRSLNESPLGCCSQTYPVSPCSSTPVQDWMGRRSFQAYPRSSPRSDLDVACKASEDQAATASQSMLVQKQQYHHNPGIVGNSRFNGGNGGVPVYVMLPLDSIKQDNSGVNRMKAMNASFQALKSAGVEGIMVDVWWGLVEREGPGHYNWNAYRQLLDMVNKHGLKVQAVMSFHQCGGNVGDSVCIPLPKWVVEEMHKDNDLAYTDQNGRRNFEYVSLGVDGLPVLKGRTPIQCYTDFMKSFRDTFSDLMGDTIVEIQVGMGPAGELRYPSYPESEGTWRFPGIGAFQCYDKYMKADLKAAAERYGKPEWGNGGPTDAGQYNNWPEDAPFFHRQGGWNSEYGEFFLSWYSGMLLNHGDTILSEADAVFQGSGAKLSAKVAGIHWHYGTRSHAPELTAGYYNTRFRDGYEAIARMLAKYGAVFNFTCIEMRDHEQPQDAQCSPENLIKQVVLATRKAGVALAGENALPRFDDYAHNQIVNNANLRQPEDTADKPVEPMCAFTYLRMCPELFQSDNWRQFISFVRRMSRGNANHSWDKEHREADQFVHESRPLVQEAAAFV